MTFFQSQRRAKGISKSKNPRPWWSKDQLLASPTRMSKYCWYDLSRPPTKVVNHREQALHRTINSVNNE